jgi:hypothetical protein
MRMIIVPILTTTRVNWVESEMEGRFLGRTAASWTGDMDTVWPEDVRPDQAALHQRALTLALASRDTMIRTVIIVASCAAKLSMAMATPGGAILALPAVWDFINRVMAEGKKPLRHERRCGGLSCTA